MEAPGRGPGLGSVAFDGLGGTAASGMRRSGAERDGESDDPDIAKPLARVAVSRTARRDASASLGSGITSTLAGRATLPFFGGVTWTCAVLRGGATIASPLFPIDTSGDDGIDPTEA